jgi:hypothetical protein
MTTEKSEKFKGKQITLYIDPDEVKMLEKLITKLSKKLGVVSTSRLFRIALRRMFEKVEGEI